MGRGCLAAFPARHPGLCVPPRVPGGPKGQESCRTRSRLRKRMERTGPGSRCVLWFPHSVQESETRLLAPLGVLTTRSPRLNRGPSGRSTCLDPSPDPQLRSRRLAGACASTASGPGERVSFQPSPRLPTPVMTLVDD